MIESRNKLGQPLFLISILILIVNDFFLKSLFHNTITGKLSDFAGLLAFPFFWSVLFPKYSKPIHFLTIVLFIFWKSELAQYAIDAINLAGLHTFRTVDFSDHIALISVGISYCLFKQPANSKGYAWSRYVTIGVSLFSFVATTQKRDPPTYEEGFKTITIHNQGNKELIAIINFSYTAAEMSKDSSLNNEFSRSDTLKVPAGAYENFITPIRRVDSVNFPAEFKVLILDSLKKAIREYRTGSFFKSLDTTANGQSANINDDSWKLTIGDKVPEVLKPYTLYGRWVGSLSRNKQHTFEIREDYYYDVNPDSDLASYTVKDSILQIHYKGRINKGRILKVKNDSLIVNWGDKGLIKYKRLYE